MLIPSLARAMKLEDGGQEFTDRVITVALSAMLVITAAVMAGAGGFVWLLASNQTPDFKSLALAFSPICLPQIFFYGLFALLGQILNARGRFGAFAWAPFLANVVAVAGLILFIFVFPSPDAVDARGQRLPREPSEWTGPMVWLFAGRPPSRSCPGAVARPGAAAHRLQLPPAVGPARRRSGGVSRLAVSAFAGLAISQAGFFIGPGRPFDRTITSAPKDSRAVPGPAVDAIAYSLFMLPARLHHALDHHRPAPAFFADGGRRRP